MNVNCKYIKIHIHCRIEERQFLLIMTIVSQNSAYFIIDVINYIFNNFLYTFGHFYNNAHLLTMFHHGASITGDHLLDLPTQEWLQKIMFCFIRKKTNAAIIGAFLSCFVSLLCVIHSRSSSRRLYRFYSTIFFRIL